MVAFSLAIVDEGPCPANKKYYSVKPATWRIPSTKADVA
jgi:hypothetical protein